MNTPTRPRSGSRELYGDDVVVVDYVMPGFALARRARRWPQRSPGSPTIKGMVLMSHGLFTFADDARESYERMIELVGRAEDYLREHGAWDVAPTPDDARSGPIGVELAALRARHLARPRAGR